MFCGLIFPQDKLLDKQNAPFTIRGNIGIPRTISSQMFHTCFNGVYEANLSLNARLGGNFFIGIGYQSSGFQNNKRIFTYYQAPGKIYGSLSYNTRIEAQATFLKLGYDKFFSPTAYMSYGLNGGFMLFNYTHVQLDTNKANQPYGALSSIVPYAQPEMSVNFIVDEKQQMALSIFLSYTTQFARFDPKAPRFNHFEEIKDKHNRYFVSWFNIGFGFSVLINRKQKAT
jgi:hypothetical protein